MVLVWLLSYFYTFLPCNWQFAAQFSYHCKPLIFQHYVKCDTSRRKWRKWREKCTGWNLDLASFNASQRRLLFDRIQKWPCILLSSIVPKAIGQSKRSWCIVQELCSRSWTKKQRPVWVWGPGHMATLAMWEWGRGDPLAVAEGDAVREGSPACS